MVKVLLRLGHQTVLQITDLGDNLKVHMTVVHHVFVLASDDLSEDRESATGSYG